MAQPDPLKPPEPLVSALQAAKRPILLTHVYPDGDGLGSQLGLARALRTLGQDPRIVNTHPAPEKYAFLDPLRWIEVLAGEPGPDHLQAIAETDTIVILDTSDPGRLGHLEAPVFQAPGTRLVIDHHLCADATLFDQSWSREDSPATGNMVLAIVEALGVPLTEEIAVPLFVAISSDTGWFRYSNASAEAFGAAARLVQAGIAPELLYGRVFESFDVGRTRLLGDLLSGLQDDSQGRIVYGVLRSDRIIRRGVSYEEIDGFIDALKAIRGSLILILFVELSPGSYKVSLRSKGEHDVHAIASHFGGGGHAKAAGCRLKGDEISVIDRILDVARSAIDAGSVPAGD